MVVEGMNEGRKVDKQKYRQNAKGKKDQKDRPRDRKVKKKKKMEEVQGHKQKPN